MSQPPKLSYISTHFRVKCELTKAQASVDSNKDSIQDLLIRAKLKMEQVKESGSIAFYFLFEHRLEAVWKQLAQSKDENPEHKVTLTLAAGAPLYQGITVEKINSDKAKVAISINIPKSQTANLRYDWFKLNVLYQLKQVGVTEVISNAQIFSLFQRVVDRNESVNKQALTSLSSFETFQSQKPLAILANKQKKEIAIILRDVRELLQKKNMENMIALVENAVKQSSTDGTQYKIFKKELSSALKSAFEGPEYLGIEMPLTLLVAMGDSSATLQGQETVRIPLANYPGFGKLNLKASQDNLEVCVEGFDVELYNDKKLDISVDWIRKELNRMQFKGSLAQNVLDELATLIENKKSLDGIVLLRGEPSIGGREPYIKLSFKEAASLKPEANLDLDSLNIRDMQQRVLVKEGQLVAEIVYKKPPKIGIDVYGKPLPPQPNDELVVVLGEGIVENEPGRFYAMFDGIPTVEETTISLSKILIHEGDVNLRTGNIRFDGPVEIKGAIDSGAIVESTGDITVYGEIRGAIVEAKGNIFVHGGVTTSGNGFVYAGGNFSADFVENSRLTVKGDINVNKALINSIVVCGGGIRAKSGDGIIAGGSIITKENLQTANLGFARGAMTLLNIGVDWRVARALEIKKSRLEKVTKKLQVDRLILRELVQKTKNFSNQKQKDQKEDLQDRLTRMRVVSEKLERQVQECQSKISFNSNARIYVRETLMANVNLTVGGQIVSVLNDLKSVCIVSKRRRGSFIVPLEEIEQEDKISQAG